MEKKQWILLIFLALFLFLVYGIIWMEKKTESEQNEKKMLSLYERTVSDYLRVQEQKQILAEKQAEKDLYSTLSSIRRELSNVSLSQLSNEKLQILKEEYHLSDLSVLRKEGEDVDIVFSTDEREIGQSTNSWGYWYDAFIALFENQQVEEGKGLQIGGYWVGPKSYKYIQEEGIKKYYKFAYLHHEEQNYLINGILAESSYSNVTEEINYAMEMTRDETDFVKELAVIDVRNLKSYIENKYDKIEDPFVIFGKISNNLVLDCSDILLGENDGNWHGDISSIYPDAYLSISKIDEDKILMSILSDELFQNVSIYHFMLEIAILFAGTILFYGAGYQYLNKRKKLFEEYEMQRLDLEMITKSFLHMPSIVMRLKNTGEEIEVQYVEGVEKEKIFEGKSIKKTTDFLKWIPKEFYIEERRQFEMAFQGNPKRFDSTIMGQNYDISLIPVEGKQGEILFFAYNVQKYIQKQEEDIYIAYHDLLTGLGNRHQFEKDFLQKTRKADSFFVMYVDMNKFKEVNDKYEHAFGDLVLGEVGKRFLKLEKEGFLFYRFGGDEFVALSEPMKIPVLMEKLKRIIEEVESLKELEGRTLNLGVSIGVSKYPENGKYAEDLLRTADRAMYHVKNLGVSAYKIATYDEN